MKESVYIGIDIGGTNIKASSVLKSGEIITRLHINAPVDEEVELYRGLYDLIQSTAEGQKIKGIGIGCAGVLALDRRSVRYSPNYKLLEGVPICKHLENKFGVSTILENDANAIALGEHWKGAGIKANTLIIITLGTGVGTGCILNGNLYRGSYGFAAEGGHTTIDFNGPFCKCGNRGCLEAFVGSYGILRRLDEKISKESNSKSTRLNINQTVEEIGRAAQAGDHSSIEIIKETGFYLGVGMANFANIFNPDMIVLTGGVSRAGEILIEPAHAEMKRRAFPSNTESLDVVTGSLGDNAGPLGAVYPLIQRDH